MRGKFFRVICFVLSVMLLFSMFLMTGCGSKEEETVIVDNSAAKTDEAESDNSSEKEAQAADKQDSGSAGGDKVLLVTGEYVPYTSEGLEEYGFFTKLVTSALKDAGIDAEIKFYPWGRCSEMVKNGEAWASFPYGHSEENDKTYLMSDVIYPSTHKFFYLKGNEKIKDEVHNFKEIADFKNYIFGGANGYWYGSQDDFKSKGVTTEWAADIDALIKMLYAKRIDFFIEDNAVCQDAIKRLYPNDTDKFATLENNARQQDYLLIVSKTYPQSEELMKKFNESLKKIKENGEFKKVLDKYGMAE